MAGVYCHEEREDAAMKIKAENLKESLTGAVTAWADGKLVELSAEHPKIKVMKTYLMNGLHNYISRHDDEITKWTEGMSLFLPAQDGCIDSDMLVDDAIRLLMQTEKTDIRVAGVDVSVGGGEITASLPDTLLGTYLFGRLGRIRITADDLIELKALVK